MKYVVSVSKTYTHRGLFRRRKATKKHWFVYYYDEEGKFQNKKINLLQALYYKTQKRKRLQYICTECSSRFIGYVKSSKEELECPYCEN